MIKQSQKIKSTFITPKHPIKISHIKGRKFTFEQQIDKTERL